MTITRIFDLIRRNTTVPGVVVVFALGYLVVLAIRSGSDAASWVQAIGSLGAIWAVVWQVGHQQEREKRSAAEREAVIVRSVQITAERAHTATLLIHYEIGECEKGNQQGPRAGMQESGRNALDSMKGIDLMTLPRVDMIEHVVTVTRCLESVLIIYAGLQGNHGNRSGELCDLSAAALKTLKRF